MKNSQDKITMESETNFRKLLLKVDGKGEKNNQLINNPNFLLLLQDLIVNINIEKLTDEEQHFLFVFLLDIHGRLFTALKLGYLELELDKGAIQDFLQEIEKILQNFGGKYEDILTSVDHIIDNIRNSYTDYIKDNSEINKNIELLGSLIVDGISKIDELDISLLNKQNSDFVNNVSLSFKIKIEEILTHKISSSLTIILEEKLLKIDKILKLTHNYNSNYIDELPDYSNSIILLDMLIVLTTQFSNRLQTEENSIILDNEYTENFLGILERVKQYKELDDIKENIIYILLNIIDSREYAIHHHNKELVKDNLDYIDDNINNNYIVRAERLFQILLKN